MWVNHTMMSNWRGMLPVYTPTISSLKLMYLTFFLASFILNRKQFMFLFYPHLAKAEMQWILQKLMTSTYRNSPNGCSLKPLFLDEWSYHPHQRKHLSLQQMESTPENHNWNNAETNTSRWAKTQWIHLSEPLYLWLKERHRRADGKIVRVRLPECSPWESLIKNEYINKTRTMAVLMDMLTWKGENVMSSCPSLIGS